MFYKLFKNLIFTIIIIFISIFSAHYIIKKTITKKTKYETKHETGHETKHKTFSKKNKIITYNDFPNANSEAYLLYSCLSKYIIIDNNKNIILNELSHLLNILNVSSKDVNKIASIGLIMSAGETSREKFNRIDYNGNQYISNSEIKALFLPSDIEKIMLENCDINFSDVFTNIDELIENIFQIGDKNNDENISYDEFKAIYIIQLLRFYKKLEPSFNLYIIEKLFQKNL